MPEVVDTLPKLNFVVDVPPDIRLSRAGFTDSGNNSWQVMLFSFLAEMVTLSGGELLLRTNIVGTAHT